MTNRPMLDSRAAVLIAGFALAAVAWSLPPAPQGQGSGISVPKPSPLPGYGAADSNNTMIAVTGMDMTGASVLYLVDTVNRHLAVYQASGGSGSMQGIKLVGARRIDLDLQLDGYNDRSEYSVQELEKKFSQLGPATPVK